MVPSEVSPDSSRCPRLRRLLVLEPQPGQLDVVRRRPVAQRPETLLELIEVLGQAADHQLQREAEQAQRQRQHRDHREHREQDRERPQPRRQPVGQPELQRIDENREEVGEGERHRDRRRGAQRGRGQDHGDHREQPDRDVAGWPAPRRALRQAPRPDARARAAGCGRPTPPPQWWRSAAISLSLLMPERCSIPSSLARW